MGREGPRCPGDSRPGPSSVGPRIGTFTAEGWGVHRLHQTPSGIARSQHSVRNPSWSHFLIILLLQCYFFPLLNLVSKNFPNLLFGENLLSLCISATVLRSTPYKARPVGEDLERTEENNSRRLRPSQDQASPAGSAVETS